MAKIKVTQTRSKIRATKRQKRTLEALGLNKISSVAQHEETPQIRGMIEKIKHMVEVEKLND